MAPGPSVEQTRRTLAPHTGNMMEIVLGSIRHGLGTGRKQTLEADGLPHPLKQKMASFVTLHRDGILRGCIGTAIAVRSLARDLSRNAYKAAFRDPRFEPLRAEEFSELSVEISVLTPPEPFLFDDEADLLTKLAPGRDGLILEQNGKSGLFLPQVWESLPDPADFLRHLKQKAGFSPEPLDRHTTAKRFEAISF